MNRTLDLFVYGTLLSGEGNHGLMTDALFVGEDALNNSQLFDAGSFPLLRPGCGIVRGERYRISKKTLQRLDQLEGHPDFFYRQPVNLVSGNSALVYFGPKDYSKTLTPIKDGCWRSYQLSKATNSHKSSWIFMYGSNLDPSRLSERVKWNGKAEVVSLKGYKLSFNKLRLQGTSALNILPCSSSKVLGILLELEQAEVERMDVYEGHPTHYKRQFVTVQTQAGIEVEAETYIAQPEWLRDGLIPTEEYLSHILAGAKYWQLPDTYIKQLEKLGKSR